MFKVFGLWGLEQCFRELMAGSPNASCHLLPRALSHGHPLACRLPCPGARMPQRVPTGPAPFGRSHAPARTDGGPSPPAVRIPCLAARMPQRVPTGPIPSGRSHTLPGRSHAPARTDGTHPLRPLAYPTWPLACPSAYRRGPSPPAARISYVAARMPLRVLTGPIPSGRSHALPGRSHAPARTDGALPP